MNEPLRLRDDPDADDALRALLRETSETPGMPAAMRQALDVKVAATAMHAAATFAVWKWFGVAALVASLGAGVWRARASSRRVPAARPVAVAVTSRSPSPPRPPPAVVAAPAWPRATPSRPVVTAPAPRPPRERARVIASTAEVAVVAPPPSPPPMSPPPPPSPPPPTSPPPTWPAAGGPSSEAAQRSAEHQLLDRARADATAGRTDEALRAVAEHERLFPTGRLCEEREAIALEALSRAGRREAVRRRGEAFLSSWPRSLYAPRVRRLLRDADDLQMGAPGPRDPSSGGPSP